MSNDRIGVLYLDASYSDARYGIGIQPQNIEAYVIAGERHHWAHGSNMEWQQARFAAKADAQAWLDDLGAPKFVGLKAGSLSYAGEAGMSGYVSFNANLLADKVNGGINETGLKRYRALVRVARAKGIEVEWRGRWANSYESQAALDEALA